MIVVGGYYREICTSPTHDDNFGSGGRAALAIALGDVKVDWYYYCPIKLQKQAQIALSNPNLTHHQKNSSDLITFEYFHPLSNPKYYPAIVDYSKQESIEVKGKNILRFGLMEGDAIVHGDKVVFDPQSPNNPISFHGNGSTAKSLAIVLNQTEVLSLGGAKSEAVSIKKIQDSENADVILVKAGTQGCRVYEDGKFKATIPPYITERVYKIGSGDVFSASFAYYWAEKGFSPRRAADAASRCTARYCNTRFPSVTLNEETDKLLPLKLDRKKSKIYIAGPFFTMAELWLVEQATMAFRSLGVDYFSPYHEVGLIGDKPSREIVDADLKGLNGCKAVFAILDGCDPGTIFEVGYAVRKKIPVVALSQNPKEGDQTMIKGSDRCVISNDFASAIYRAVWESYSK